MRKNLTWKKRKKLMVLAKTLEKKKFKSVRYIVDTFHDFLSNLQPHVILDVGRFWPSDSYRGWTTLCSKMAWRHANNYRAIIPGFDHLHLLNQCEILWMDLTRDEHVYISNVLNEPKEIDNLTKKKKINWTEVGSTSTYGRRPPKA